MRGEGSGKGDQLRYGVDWNAYSENYDAIFRKKRVHSTPSGIKYTLNGKKPWDKKAFLALDEKGMRLEFEPQQDVVTLMRLRESAKKATKKK